MQVLVADDHPLYREAVRLRLERMLPGCKVVEASSFQQIVQAAEMAKAEPFDLVLLDLHLSDTEPTAVVEAVMRALPGTPVLLMSGAAGAPDIKRVVAAVARGFLPKTMGSDNFATAVSMVLAGGSYLPVEALQETAAGNGASVEKSFETLLTARERQVLTLLATGASNKEIARELSLAEVTIKLHVRQILRKIDARNRSEAASMAVRAGLT